jgi:hypothetical protein
MKNEQSQIQQQPSRLFEMKILRLATLLSEGDEGLDRDGLRLALDSAGIDSRSSYGAFPRGRTPACRRLAQPGGDGAIVVGTGHCTHVTVERGVACPFPRSPEGRLTRNCRPLYRRVVQRALSLALPFGIYQNNPNGWEISTKGSVFANRNSVFLIICSHKESGSELNIVGVSAGKTNHAPNSTSVRN